MVACVVEHWLLVGTMWGAARIRLGQAGRVLRGFAARIASPRPQADDLLTVLRKLTAPSSRPAAVIRERTPELLNSSTILHC